jgi:hypothetical protein
MENYIVTAPFIQINPGAVIKLDGGQARSRKFALRKVKNDIYEVINPFHLKMGESFGSKEFFDKKFANAIVEKSEFEEIPIAERIKDFNRPLLVKFAEENCKDFELDLSKTNAELKKDIVSHMVGDKEEPEKLEEPEVKQSSEQKKRGRKKAPIE